MSLELSIIVKTTVILAAAGLAAGLLRRASSSTRHALWVIALLNALLLPVGTAFLPTLAIPVLPQHETAADAVKAPIQLSPATIPHGRAAPTLFLPFQQAPPQDAASASPFTVQQFITTIWILGFAVVFFRLARATRAVRQLARRSKILGGKDWDEVREQLQSALGISRHVQLRIGGSLPPMTWGVVRHVILLPESALAWSGDRRRVVLAHELAHVKRHDGVLQLFVQFVCSVYWFSPMVWFAANRLRIERERACDDRVLNLGAAAEDYADHLLQIARGVRSAPSLASVSMADSSQLETRVISILDAQTKRRRLSRLAAMGLLTTVGVLTASIAAIQVTALAAMTLPSFETPLTAPVWLVSAVRPAQQAQVSDAAALEGTVVRSGTTEPVPHARLILNMPGSENPLTVTAGDSGQFAFENVAPGRYQLVATHDGYVHIAYGQRGPNGAGSWITLAAKQAIRDIVLSMTPTSAISGKIRNKMGEPIANASVQALQYRYESGHKVLTLIQTTKTNDLGEYRLYYLDPGQYIVSAIPPLGPRAIRGENGRYATVELLPGDANSTSHGISTTSATTISTLATALAGQGFLSAAVTGETYVPQFFPGVDDPTQSLPVNLEPGANFNAVDFTVAKVRAVLIRGKALDGTTNQPLQGLSMVLLSQGTGIGIPRDTYGSTSDAGSFEFHGIAPGSYDLIASVGTLTAGIPSIEAQTAGLTVIDHKPLQFAAANAASPRLAARVFLAVGASDLDDIALPLKAGYSIGGKIVIDGLSSAESALMTSGMIIHLQPDPRDFTPQGNSIPVVQTAAAPAIVGQDGTFVIRDAFAGVYQIGLFNGVKLPNGAFVKSVKFGDMDASSTRLVIDGPPRSALEIVVSTTPGTFDAVVDDEKQLPVPDTTVVLVPDADHQQRYDLYRFATADGSGHAHFDNVVPGDYTAYASDVGQDGAWWDSEFMKKYEGRGKPIHINEGGKQTIGLKWIPYR